MPRDVCMNIQCIEVILFPIGCSLENIFGFSISFFISFDICCSYGGDGGGSFRSTWSILIYYLPFVIRSFP